MRSNKIFIVAAIMLAFGILFACLGYLVTGNSGRRFFTMLGTTEEYREGTFDVDAADIHTIRISDQNTRVRIRPADHADAKDISVTHYESEHMRYTIRYNDGVLEINKRDTRRWYEHIGFLFWSSDGKSHDLVVTVPQDWVGTYKVSTNNASVTVQDLSLLDNSYFHTSNSGVTLERITCVDNAAIDLKSSNGTISLRDIQDGDLTLKTSNSSIELTEIDCAHITATTSNARVTATNVNVSGDLSLKSSNGRILVEGGRVEGYASIRTSNSSIRINYLQAEGGLTLKTSNGSISGSLPGSLSDYRIDSGTSNGSNSLPGRFSEGSIELSVHTSNASIDISFVG